MSGNSDCCKVDVCLNITSVTIEDGAKEDFCTILAELCPCPDNGNGNGNNDITE